MLTSMLDKLLHFFGLQRIVSAEVTVKLILVNRGNLVTKVQILKSDDELLKNEGIVLKLKNHTGLSLVNTERPKIVVYKGRCDRCDSSFEHPTEGEKACGWGRCNGTVLAHHRVER